jgi:uncharacterized protein YecE (DUF72 family)
MSRFIFGTSGFQYDHWKGTFYPETLPRSDWFSHYSGIFGAVEINNTFYGLPSEKTFDTWREQAPEGFTYALKFSRYGSHMKHLKDPEETIATFMEGARRLQECLGPVLVQLPPRWRPDPERLEAFLKAVPGEVRWVVELRNPHWLREDVLGILEKQGAALCIHDLLEFHPRKLTADWTYLRFHGPEKYSGSYPSKVLQGEAGWITAQLEGGTDVYAFFNNDEGGMAPRNARELANMVAPPS